MPYLEPVLLLLFAFCFFTLEMMIPSFGLFLILGLFLDGSAVFSAFSVDRIYGWCTLGAGVAGMPASFYLGFRLLPHTPLVLKNVYEPAVDRRGIPRPAALSRGAQGAAKSALRPMGTAVFAGVAVEVTSAAGRIEPGTRVEVVECAGRRVVVRPLEEP
ncbi:MAG: NfeD family protein [Planctomycetota bacterium]